MSRCYKCGKDFHCEFVCGECSKSEVARLKVELYEVRVSRSQLDCRYTPGPYADSGGKHCPSDKPCERCRQEAEVERLKAQLELERLKRMSVGMFTNPEALAIHQEELADKIRRIEAAHKATGNSKQVFKEGGA